MKPTSAIDSMPDAYIACCSSAINPCLRKRPGKGVAVPLLDCIGILDFTRALIRLSRELDLRRFSFITQ